MEVKELHDWNLSYSAAAALQNELAGRIRLKPVKKRLKTVAGLDCSIIKEKGKLIAGVVVMEYGTSEVLERQYAVTELNFPYIPGLLSFREGFGCIEAVKKLKIVPDVFVIDGQGIAHPRKLGLATHLGLFFDLPTVGCAKSRLVGEFDVFKLEKGNFSDLRYKDEIIGAVLCSRSGIKPLFISPGHECDIKSSVNIVLDNAIKYRLPEPTREAHLMVSRLKREIF